MTDSPNKIPSKHRLIHTPLIESPMRRSRSAGDKFVFGARRRTLTPAPRKPIATETPSSESGQMGVVSPRPIRSVRPQLKSGTYWSSNYALSDYSSKHPEAFDEQESKNFHEWLFQKEKGSSVDNDIRKLIKMLFNQRNK